MFMICRQLNFKPACTGSLVIDIKQEAEHPLLF